MGDTLRRSEIFSVGPGLTSGEFALGLTPNGLSYAGTELGDLQLLHEPSGFIFWMPMPRGTPAELAWLTYDGDFCLCAASHTENVPRGETLWSTGTRNRNVDRLLLRRDVHGLGTVDLLTADSASVWTSKVPRGVTGDTAFRGDLLPFGSPGLTSGGYALTFTADGPHLLDQTGKTVWSAMPPGVLHDQYVWRAGLDLRGNFAAYAPRPDLFTEVWSTGTGGLGVERLTVHEGYFALYTANGTEVWRS